MPFYDYRCRACAHAFEAFHKISDPAPAECPACGQPEVEKSVSAPAIGGSAGPGHVHGPGCNH